MPYNRRLSHLFFSKILIQVHSSIANMSSMSLFKHLEKESNSDPKQETDVRQLDKLSLVLLTATESEAPIIIFILRIVICMESRIGISTYENIMLFCYSLSTVPL